MHLLSIFAAGILGLAGAKAGELLRKPLLASICGPIRKNAFVWPYEKTQPCAKARQNAPLRRALLCRVCG